MAAIDCDSLAVLNMARAAGRPPFEALSAPEAREAYARGRKVVAAPPADVASVQDMHVDGALALRVYRGAGTNQTELLPALLYLHGGGWVVGDLESHDSVCRGLANAARCCVVAVDYRLSPENRFPAALDDGIAATRWLHASADMLRIDAHRIAVGGDSAGANLAAVLALLARDGLLPPCSFQLLVYPCTDLNFGHDAHRRAIRDLGLTPASMRWFREQYLSSEEERLDWRASPLRASSLRGTAPAFVVTAGHDPLSDEGEAYALRLRDEGVAVTHHHLPDQIHGFLAMGGAIRRAGVVIGQIGSALAHHWRAGPPPLKGAPDTTTKREEKMNKVQGANGRRTILRGAAVLATAALTGRAQAQGIGGGRPVSLVMPYAPSGGQEMISRIMTEAFGERFGGTFVTEHRPGAGTTLAARHVARARPDGSTLLVGTNVTFSQAQFAYRAPGFDPDTDFTHISLLSEALYLLTVNPRWESLEALVAEARRRPGQLAFTSWGVGSVAHLLGVDFCRREGIDMIHVPFNGTGPALMEVIAGRADFIFCIMSSCLPHVEGGRLRALATPSPERIPAFPQIKTMVELGYPDFVSLPWFSLSGPAGLPEETASALEAAVIAAFRTESAKRRLDQLGLVPAARGSADMKARIVSDRAVSRRLMMQAGIEPQ